MKVEKEALGGQRVEPTEEELALVNRQSRKELTAAEVYLFAVRLCDNEVDRDGEQFPQATLEQLAELFVGKSGIFDHRWSAGGQTARIYRTEVVREEGIRTALGEPACYLKGYAYMVRTQGNQDLIAEIEGGIKREVSVGCAVKRAECSICGSDMGRCAHEKGKRYDGRLCCTVLDDPYDAYEWSFVAVPAQREAGVIKMYTPTDTEEGTRTSSDIIKAFSEGKEMTLSPEECAEISGCLRELAKKAEAGEAYERELRQEVVRLSLLSQPGVPKDIMERVAKRMTLEELKAFQKAYRQESGKLAPPKPQLAGARAEGAPIENAEFKI
mgnify:CR=1 FL=1